MLYKGLMFSAASGKLNGTVWAHNRGGTYVRSLSIPVDPQSTRQINCRDAMTDLKDWWQNELTPDERATWLPYSLATPQTNRLGDRHTLSPWAAFCRHSFVRAQVAQQLGYTVHMARNAPTDPPGLTGPATATLNADNASIDVAWSSAYNWEIEDEQGIIVYASQAIRPTVNFHKGPYQLRTMIVGDEEDPPLSPFNVPLGFTLAPGEKCFFRLRFTSNSGPTSNNWPGVVQRPF